MHPRLVGAVQADGELVHGFLRDVPNPGVGITA